MLQLTFHAQLPNPALVELVHASYMSFLSRSEGVPRNACLSVTLTDLGAAERVRYRALCEHLGPAGSCTRVVTEAADARAAMCSGLSALLSAPKR